MAKGKWTAFPYPDKAFDYAGDKLQKSWAKLHQGDQEPFPDGARVGRLLKANPKLGKAADADRIAAKLQDAWRAYHRGAFEEATEAGIALGPIGAVVACKAEGIHTANLVDKEAEKLKRFEAIAARAQEAAKALPDEANCHYFNAFALGRYSQLISVTKALAQGIASKVRESLDRTLKLAPRHGEAHLALALYHAEIVSKIGGMIASLTYGAKASTAEDHIKTALKLIPDMPIAHLEHGNAILLLYGDRKADAAAAAYDKAAKLKPRDAMDALDAASAKAQLE